MKKLLALFNLFVVVGNLMAQSPLTINIVQVAKVPAPVAMATPNDGSKRIFICEQTGKVRIVKDGNLIEEPFLDVSKKLDNMGKAYSEKGLLGIAFHPNYKKNGRFFIYYTAPDKSSGGDHRNVIAEYKVSSDPDKGDENSETQLISISQPESNHCGGQIVFGPDGYLYAGFGDGGGAGDQHGKNGNAQDLGTLLGKIIRIDVNKLSPYSVPDDNPFVNRKEAKAEIWCYGMRNPWRFSFDKKTGKLFCADVGQNKWEEIDIIQKGKNYGWRTMEGLHCFEPSQNCDQKGLEMPVAEYDHNMGISITGGFVYRGSKYTQMQGKYIFGDWKGKMYYLEERTGKWELKPLMISGKKDNDADFNINSFGEDQDGEIYILGQKVTGTIVNTGALYKIEGK